MHKLRNILLLFLFAPLLAQAQATDALQYAVAPQAPGPNQQVVIELSGVGSFLGDSQVTWTKDGTVVAQGTGLGRYTFTTGALGERTTIEVRVDSASQGVIRRSFSFNPALVNLVWEADTTVPTFYKGKSLYSAGSPLRVLALPVVYSGSSRVGAGALSYQWSLNDEPQPQLSGLGKNSVSFVGDQLRTGESVSVDVYYGATQVARGEVFVPAINPALVLYERDPLRGLILDVAFPAAAYLTGQEATLQAIPFYFSRPDLQANNLSYSWQLNGTEAAGPDSSRGILTLRQTGGGQGSATVGVALQNYNTNAFVQQAETAIQLIFGQQPSALNSIFGI